MDTLALQGYMRTALGASTELAALVGTRIYDRVPSPPVFPYIVIGLTQGIDQSVACLTDWEVFAQLDIWSRAVGFPEAKRIACECDEALAARYPNLNGFRVGWFEPVGQRFLMDPDGVTSHGVLDYRSRYGPEV
jgi:hypothetical protein